MDILRDAMEIEMNGIELYKTAAEKTGDRQAKEMFQFLANDKPKFGAIFSDEFKKNLRGKNYEYSVLTTGLLLEKKFSRVL
jgi:rubrerythrin